MNKKKKIVYTAFLGLLTALLVFVGVFNSVNNVKADTLQIGDKFGDNQDVMVRGIPLNYIGNSYLVPVAQAKNISFFVTGSLLYTTPFKVSFLKYNYETASFDNVLTYNWYYKYTSMTMTVRDYGTPNARNVTLYKGGLVYDSQFVNVGGTIRQINYINVSTSYTSNTNEQVNLENYTHILISFPQPQSPNPTAINNAYAPNINYFVSNGVMKIDQISDMDIALDFVEGFIPTLEGAYQMGIDRGYRLGIEYYERDLLPNIKEQEYQRGYDTAQRTLEHNYRISFSWFLSLFSALSSIFAIKIFGDLTLGAIVIVPFGLSLVWFIIRSLRGGS